MKTVLPPLAIIIFGTFFTIAQKPAPAPTPPPADETDVVKITTALIQLDVTVTDRRGKVVTDLSPDEVEIFENGQRQKITNFSFVSNIRAAAETPDRDKKVPAITPPTSPLRTEQVRRTIALVVDDLSLSFESTHFVRRALKKFVDEQMQPGDLVAIIRTGAGIGALQQFTSDRRQLHLAIERVRWNSLGSGGIGAFAPIESRIGSSDAEDDDDQRGSPTADDRQREADEFRESLFATGTLGAIDYVIRGMRDLPGRKSILLLSDGFSIYTRDSSGMLQSSRILANLRRLVDRANRASVVLYTMDARGLQTAGFTAADDVSGRSAAQLDQLLASRRTRLLDTQDGLRYLARHTGGIAIVNNNDLSAGIRRVLDDQSYYLVGYEPDDATFDPKLRRFNQIEVKIKRPGTTVRYRSGFFGITDDRLETPQQTGAQRLVAALISPFAVQEISLRLNALYFNSPKDGDVIRSLVHIRGQDIVFTDTPDGGKKATFEILAAGFGDNGVPIEQISKTYDLTIKRSAFEKFLETGFVYDFVFPIKRPGAYQLRIALRDHGSDKLGSANQFVEVPNLKKHRLQLSGVALDNLSFQDWQKQQAGQIPSDQVSDALADTSLRRFKRGTVLIYGFTIYNAKLLPAPSLSSQTRLFRDGKLIYEGTLQRVVEPRANAKSLDLTSALALGSEMVAGDYVMQISIIDNLAKAKRNTATQFVQFEIVE